ncbi:hypothetical protein H4R21_004578 [Coemansia helicoidea]|uniref:Uncharacterized protein n=1 Tax=Coemansia helicoidea TaxID=1286919 RepID=A0ACC1KWK3_9FUNG|nr:hypothetical protein H4R21_004578 [Coemansia helicoidea]
MAKLSQHDKEKARQTQEVEARLRASATSAAHVVDGWLGGSDSDNDSREPAGGSGVKARDLFQGRPARLGVGAKFLSHREMQNNSSSAGLLTADELSLKRKLTRGAAPPAAQPGAAKDAATNAGDISDDDVDSRSKMVSRTRPPAGAAGPAPLPPPAKKKKKAAALLDSLVQRRRR